MDRLGQAHRGAGGGCSGQAGKGLLHTSVLLQPSWTGPSAARGTAGPVRLEHPPACAVGPTGLEQLPTHMAWLALLGGTAPTSPVHSTPVRLMLTG